MAWWLLLAVALGQSSETPEGPVEEPPPLVSLPELLHFVQAPYPPEALEAEQQGIVGLLLEIDAEGAVVSAEVLRSDPLFDAAAVEASLGFLFSPAEDETGPIGVIIEFDYGFVLDSAEVEDAQPEEPVVLPIQIEGTVLEMATRRPLEGMSVVLLELERATETDENGHFEFRGVETGEHTLRVIRPGWQVLERTIALAEDEVLTAELWVKHEGWREDAAVGFYQRAREEITRRTISIQEIRRIPGTFGDPVRVIQNLPGAARTPFGSGGLIIRGANPEDTGVYIDGIRIPLIYHLGGYVSVFNADLLETVDYLPGGYSVQYGRSLGGVVDVTTRKESSEQPRMTWSTDILDSGGLYEARLGDEGQHHVAFAARRSYIDALMPLFLSETSVTASPRWYDYQARYFHAGAWDVTAMVFGFNDKLIISTADDVAQGTDPDTQGEIGIEYATHRVLLKMEREFSDQWRVEFVPSVGIDYANFGLGSTFNVENFQTMIEVRAESVWSPDPRLDLAAGIDFLGALFNFDVTLPFSPSDTLAYDPTSERESWSMSDDGSAWSPDFYFRAAWRPLADPDAFLLVPGLRFSFSQVVDMYSTWDVDPRIAMRARLTPRGFLKAGWGIYTQPPQPFESYNPSGVVDLEMERALATSVGWEQDLGHAFFLDFDAFYKDLDNLIVENQGLSDFNTQSPYTNNGIGRAYGLEVMLRRAAIDSFFGWISYTLSQSDRIDEPEARRPEWYPFDFDQTHILTVLGGWELPYAFRMSGRFQYITGNPYTPYSLGIYDIDSDFYTGIPSGDRNSERMPPNVHLDLRVEKRFTFQRWRLDTYIDVLNLYKGENPEYVQYNYDYTESKYITGLPLIPSIGFEVEVFP